MNIARLNVPGKIAGHCLLAFGFMAAAAVQAVTLNVVENDGVTPVNGFRWILQQDATFPVDPASPSTNPDELLSLSFHASYHPVAQNGNSDIDTATITAPPGRYYVSVLPYSGYSISGQSLEVLNGDETVTVTVQQHPIPTAQIALYLFHDNFPVNGAPDLPEETNPAPGDAGHVDWTQFNILVEEPAGRYGIAGGQVIQDAFGNPLGTSYIQTCDATGANPGTGAYGCLDADGSPIVDVLGDGTLQPLADGTLLIENLAPGKYGIVVIPPTGSTWQQTTTIEGTKVIDAWVKANEPPFFVEFGPPGPHVFMGFVQPFDNLPPGGTATVSGNITDMHMSRPPNFEFFSGRDFPSCWIAINEANPAGLGAGLWAGPCSGPDSNFSVANVPPGSYQLKVFDANLDVVIASQGFTVDDNGTDCNAGTTPGCIFGDVAVFNWFARLNAGIFNDVDQDGFWDANEIGIGPESQDVSIRWRDGTIYQNFPTDGDGLAPFDEVFPFFHWLVAEVSFANKKATGATFVVDAGGEVLADQGWTYPSFDEMTPQPQVCTEAQSLNPDDPDAGCVVGQPINNINTGNNLSRTEVGPVLTAGFQGFLGQTSVMQFGKTDYVNFDWTASPPTFVGENGGISGLVYYATTRAENEPQFAAAEEWEPGVPRVQVNLYADGDIDSFPLGDFPGMGDVDWNEDGIRDLDDDVIDDINGDGVVTLSDVDNYPFGWSEGGAMGPEDVENSGTDGVFDLGDAVQVTWTDSWDDSLPTGCQGQNNLGGTVENPSPYTPPVADNRCFDGLRNFNQVRPGVFDGGYAFADYDMGHLAGVRTSVAATAIQAFYDAINATVPNADKLQLGLIPGDYIVEAVTPPGYKLMKEEDKNVDFGDAYIPSPQAIAAYCVGDDRVVPPYLSMVTKDGTGMDPAGDGSNLTDMAFLGDAGAEAPFAGIARPLCDRKKVPLSAAQNAAAEFWVMTDVPIAGNISGVILNDLGNEFNPNSPAFGEKYAPPNVPVGFYDWNGKEVNRVYADTNGRYNLVVPSTFTTNLPQPSGMSPNMLVSCMNDAGIGPEPDPFWNPQFSQFCYTFQYMPGAITYLDTPVEPIAAFASPVTFPVDCDQPATTPVIASVTRDTLDGPYGFGPSGSGNNSTPGDTILIDSMGLTEVDNPDWDGTTNTDRKITRDYSFAAGCTAALEDEAGNRTPLDNVSCTAAQASGEVPDVAAGPYQVVVINPDLTESPIGVTFTVGSTQGQGDTVLRVPDDHATIQGAIDAAGAGNIILVGPKADGTQYDELVIMWKPVKLQGWGAGAVTINARQVPTEKVANWRAKAAGLVSEDLIDQLPGQALGVPGFPALAEAVFPTEEGAGIFVAGKASGNNSFGQPQNRGARIDGFSIIGASTGGALVVNGYAQYLQIGNNRIIGNAGAFGGGIRIGHPQLSHEENNGDLVYDDAVNDFIRIHHNHIAKNGGRGGAGGGLSLHTGADEYTVEQNWICGNFSSGNGGGIGHLGLSDLGVIEDNMILFNESFAQAGPRSGGGIFISGQPALQATGALLLSPGTGNVSVDSNLIRGNLAGAGDGGGIQLLSVNGEDVDANSNQPSGWYRVDIVNNMIDNNVAGLAGGGISLLDAVVVSIQNNTVAHNETTATTALAFSPGVFNQTNATPAGIVSRTHSPDFEILMGSANVPDPDWSDFSDPALSDSIVEHNRSFFWLNFDDPLTPTIETGLFPANCPVVNGQPGTGSECDVTAAGYDPADHSADLAVMDGPFTVADPVLIGTLDPQFSLLTNNADNAAYIGVNGNVTGNPGFVNGYFNGARGNIDIQEFTTIQTAGAFDEGGNFIQVTYGPLSLLDPGTGALLDYHVGAGAAINLGDPANALSVDFDNDPRPQGGRSDIGADEAQ
jgi:hypothetical protein